MTHWKGASNQEDPTDPETDYGRACLERSDVGLIDVGPGQGLVLGSGRRTTTKWWTSPRGGGTIVHWVYAEGDTDDIVVKALEDISEDSFAPTGLVLTIAADRMFIFDSAYPGDEAAQMSDSGTLSLDIPIAPGAYRIESAKCTPDDRTSLELHRLRAT